MTAISTGHRPAGPGKENGQGITEPNLMASDTRRGSPAGSPAVRYPGLPAAGSGLRPSRPPAMDGLSADGAGWLAAARGGRGAVVANLLQPDGDVRHQDQVVVAQDHFDLGAGQVQTQRPARLGGDSNGAVAGLHRDETQASFHRDEDT
jgi:hypothetical protein